MAVPTSQASVMADSDGQIDSVESIEVVDTAAVAVDVSDNTQARRRNKWFQGRTLDDGGDPAEENKKDKGLSISCRCKGAVQASFLITCASVIELIGNMLALVYGISFIQGAVNFYALDSDPEKKAQEYDEKLDRVLFLETNRVGFVGLLATSLVGLIVAFLMPIGTVYRSWKSLRAAMSLLFSMCVAHVVLAAIYLTDNELLATLAAVPFRVYEIFLIYNHINYYKKKKRDDALRKQLEAQDSGLAGGPSQNYIGSSVSGSINGSQRDNITGQSQINMNTLGQNDSTGNPNDPNAKNAKLVKTASGQKLNVDGDDDTDTDGDIKQKGKKAKKRNKAALQLAAQGDWNQTTAQTEWNQNPNFLSSNFFVQADPPEFK